MPNWVKTEIILTGDKNQIHNLLEKCYSLDEETNEKNFFDFNGVIPMPNHIFRGNLGVEEMAKYGEDNWYDWSIENWGTKWNACEASVLYRKDGVIVTFNTAWNFPLPIIKAIKEQYPDIGIYAAWADEDLGNNCGIYNNGEITYEDDLSVEPFNFACDVWGYDINEMREEYGIS